MRLSSLKLSLLGLVLTFSVACQRTWQGHPNLQKTALVVSDKTATDAAAEKTIVPYREKVNSKMGEVIGFAPLALEKNPVESALGNFVADLQRSQAEKLSGKPVDMGVTTNGGLRTLVPQGNIKVGDMFELMPFENELVILTANGATVQQLFDYAAAKKTTSIANATYTIKDNLPQDILIAGKPLDLNQSYRIAISDYLANGGDDMAFFKTTLNWEKPGITVRDAIIKHIREQTAQGKQIEAKVEGRVKVL